jgi:hypothetical protein
MSRIRFPTDTQLFRAIIKRQWLISSGGTAHIKQTGLLFEYIRKHVSLKELVSCLNRTLLGQFLREICPFKKVTPFSGAINGTLA